MVTAEEEVELAIRIRNGDEIALKRLVEANLRFVISVAKQFQNQGLAFADLINEGNVGLVKAAKKFDETRGFKFISYAVWWIRQSIMQSLSETRVVRLPVNRIASLSKISKAAPYLEQKLEREPTNNEIAEFLDVKEDFIEENRLLKFNVHSLDKSISANGDGAFCLIDIIEIEKFPGPDSGLMADSLKMNLLRAVGKLSPREAEIINLSFGLNNHTEHSLNEIACLYDMSSERIRQIRSKGLLKLKGLMTGKQCFCDNI